MLAQGYHMHGIGKAAKTRWFRCVDGCLPACLPVAGVFLPDQGGPGPSPAAP